MAHIEEGHEKPKGRIYVAELSESLDRSIHTIRLWEKNGLLPKDCLPHRDSRQWRYWLPDQVDRIREWMESRPMQSDEKLQKMRRPRAGAEAAPTT